MALTCRIRTGLTYVVWLSSSHNKICRSIPKIVELEHGLNQKGEVPSVVYAALVYTSICLTGLVHTNAPCASAKHHKLLPCNMLHADCNMMYFCAAADTFRIVQVLTALTIAVSSPLFCQYFLAPYLLANLGQKFCMQGLNNIQHF